MLEEPTREFRDPIHGFIEVYPHEKAIIDTFPFQRLRRLSQLGLTSRIYHGAEHSRFGHSLGVMHLAGKATKELIRKHGGLIRDAAGWTQGKHDQESERLVLIARLAGLLHDVGHAPFSHTGEKSLFEGDFRHEDYSAAVIENTEIGHIIDEKLKCKSISKTDVVALLRDHVVPTGCVFLSELLDGAYDVDKMDYVLRDSHYCGVEYGTFDISRLIATLTLYEQEDGTLTLAMEDGGYHTLEALVIARYFMFTQVYFHGVRRANDLIMTDFIQELLKDECNSPHYPPPGSADEYLKWDDSRVLTAAVQRCDGNARNFAWMITNRRHPKIAYETGAHPDSMEARTAFRTLLPEVKARFPDVRIWRDKAIDHPQRYKQENIPIKRVQDDPPTWKSFVGTSAVLRGLEDIGQVRLYADVGDRKELLKQIHEFCRQKMA